ncbi:hypothetical protein [Imperialibacter roseus]|uniref:Uncharacterized protein n=1 Tax=Imperialibacter roseus TaxID=1324217 RepID=A0ABZ0IR39_9BACT|nr:hypothetical protein [Imperialibacter roseus]WOK06893.1 hypothetical protein RT717_27880 [Imperialibacter roseus]|tara:strand:+ start:5339 stop:5518 length:180 start_codon:yes stop_codon:yes gene_type:complete
MNISSKGYDTPDEVGNYSIKRNKISFLPSAEMRENMGRVSYSKYVDTTAPLLFNEPDEV